ncbi:MAG: hypothetical protein EHM48_00420 [Planctomycetaceae bacterium]|nr:MAG: hypothetical protein EHM48_00420 [Planctomycetaceae bacterium]
MKVFACCAKSFEPSVIRAAGVKPVTCPPLALADCPNGILDGYDFYYFKLHGMQDQPYWYGDNWLTALATDTIIKARMSGAVVFVANCFLPESPMLWALLKAGARAVVGGSGENYARPNTVDGADLIGMWLRRGLSAGLRVESAFKLARSRAWLTFPGMVRDDMLQFRMWKQSDFATLFPNSVS